MKKKSNETIHLERRLKLTLLSFFITLVILCVTLFLLFLPILKEDYCLNQRGKGVYGLNHKEVLRCEKETVVPYLF